MAKKESKEKQFQNWLENLGVDKQNHPAYKIKENLVLYFAGDGSGLAIKKIGQQEYVALLEELAPVADKFLKRK